MRLMKKLICALLLLSMLAVPAFGDQLGSVTGSYVFLRAGPGTSYAQIGGCAKGTNLVILASENGWFKVSVNGLTGYISADYVTTDPSAFTTAPSVPPQSTEPPADAQYGTVTGGIVNIRAGAASFHARVGQAHKGDRVLVLALVDGWYKISTDNGQLGYISAEYIRLDTPAVTTAPATTPLVTTPPVTTAPATTADPAAKYGVVTGSVVNLRSAASTSSAIVGAAKKGERLVVLESVDGWYRIRQGALTAHIHADYLQLEEQPVTPPVTTTTPATTAPAKPEEPGAQYAAVTGSVVNLRSAASTTSTIVGQAHKGERYRVAAKSGDWYQIYVNTQLVYIHSDYVTVEAGQSGSATVGTVTGGVVNIRAGAAAFHARVGQAYKGDKVTILGSENGWYKISTENGQVGYISAEYIQTEAPSTTVPPATAPATTPPPATTVPDSFTVSPLDDTGVITGSYVNIREYPSTNATVLGLIAKGKYVDILGSVGSDWYKVSYGSVTGFISAQYVQPGVAEYNRPVSGVITGASGSGLVSSLGSQFNSLPFAEQLCQYAKTFIGVPYVYGGSLPETGFDCSGFTKYVYAHFGITIPRLKQYEAGRRVEKADLQPGDLVFFNTTGVSISHVGLYIGYGQFIHAPTVGKSVCITELESDYYASRFVCAVRILD